MRLHYPYEQAASFGPEILPRVIVLHDTAGRLDYRTSVDWFRDPSAGVSAHFVVGRAGEVVQMVPLTHAAYHAGLSSFQGAEGVNNFSVGIEMVNPGKLDGDGRAWFGESFPGSLSRATLPHGSGRWLPYPVEQIEAVKELVHHLTERLPIEAITTHWEVSPGRKIDPGPLFPLREIEEVAMLNSTHGRLEVRSPIHHLPGYTSTILAELPAGSVLEIKNWIQTTDGFWVFVDFGGRTGWVHSDHLRRLP